MQALKEHYGSKAQFLDEMDGVTFDFGDWWFNVRGSNTEPLLRLNVEADTEPLMEEKRDDVVAFIRS